MEPFYPLHAYVCSACRLVQLEEFESPQHIFSDYIYFVSYSESWLRHAEAYAETMTRRLGLTADRNGRRGGQQRRLPAAIFQAARHYGAGHRAGGQRRRGGGREGHPDRGAFFGRQRRRGCASRVSRPDLVVANNVLAHVPDINDFVRGFAIC